MTNFKLMICLATSAALQACAFVPHVSLRLHAPPVMSIRSTGFSTLCWIQFADYTFVTVDPSLSLLFLCEFQGSD
jgi:hypothetical protein